MDEREAGMSIHNGKSSGQLVTELVDHLAASQLEFDDNTINVLSALINNERGWQGEAEYQDRIKATEVDPGSWLYQILPLKKHSVTIVQKIQVSIDAVSPEHAVEKIKRHPNPRSLGEVFETDYVDAFLQDT